jgi:serine protease
VIRRFAQQVGREPQQPGGYRVRAGYHASSAFVPDTARGRQMMGERRRGAASRGAAGLLLASLTICAGPAFADVTHLTVRFRDTATGVAAPQDRARLQEIAAAARSGIGNASVTRDGAYRVALTPALSDDGSRVALHRLRMDGAVLYAEAENASSPAVTAMQHVRPSPRLARVIVKFREPGAAADAANDRPLAAERLTQLAARAGVPLAHQRTMAWARAHVLQLLAQAPQEEVEAIARAIERDPDVEWAQPDYLRFRNLVPNDPLYASQWHYHAPGTVAGGANLPAAWDRTTGWSGTRVAVLDTGALKTHPDLANRFIGGHDFVYDWIFANDGDPPQPGGCLPTSSPLLPPCVSSRDTDASDPGDWTSAGDDAGSTFGGWLVGCGVFDSSWHGTHVAGTVGAASNNATGVAGVNWVSRIVPVRVLGKCGGYDSDIADAIEWASGGAISGVPANAFPARVLNLSLGGGGACAPALQSAITNALGRQSVVVVSAGNENTDAAGSAPANCNGVVTVAAVGRSGQRASYSNFGPTVEIAAPGGGDGQAVLSTLNSGTTVPLANGMNYASYQGTSMAAPHVAGIVSLLLSLKPALTPAQVTVALQSTARAFPAGTGRDCTSNLGAVGSGVQFCGAGIVNADGALADVATTGGPGGVPLLASTAALSSTPNPSAPGGIVTLTATLSGTPTPTGTVDFTDADAVLAGCASVPLVAGSAQCATASLAIGTHELRAAYSGSATHRPTDSAPLAHVVNPLTPQPTTTTIASSANPSSEGAPVTFTASVTGLSPTGTLAFRANGATIAGCGAVALAGSSDTRNSQCTTSALAAGAFTVEATYSGNAVNLGSTATMAQGVIGPLACGRFNDVPATSPFCTDVQWILNRAVTLGCGIVEYCPAGSTVRLAMAAFLQREGTALTSHDVPLVVDNRALNLAAPQVACFETTRSYAVTGHPRRARLRSFANVYGATASTAVTVENVYSTDGGATWNALPAFNAAAQTLYAGRVPAEDQTMNLYAELDLDVGASYIFGLRFSAVPAAATVSVYCSYQARIFNRNGASAPF